MMVITKALKDQIPEGDQRSKGALIEGFIAQGQPGGQHGRGQQLVETAQELGGGEAGAQQLGSRGWGGFGFGGAAAGRGWAALGLGRLAVGFRSCHVCMYYNIHT